MVPDFELEKEAILGKFSELWNSLTDAQEAKLRECMTIKHYKKNEYIYKEHETPTEVMCLVEGKVKILKAGIDGKKVIIRIIKPMEFIGFRAIVVDDYFHASAETFDDATVAFFPEHVIHDLIAANPDIAFYFLKNRAVHYALV